VDTFMPLPGIKVIIPTTVGRQMIHEMRFWPTTGGKSMGLTVAFGRTLRRLRLDRNMTQEQLGIAADLQRKYISWLERGEKQPSLTTIFKLANALQIQPSAFLSEIEQELENELL
jgi:DNA-binding XRE family transcriptional regulator